jgi:hypothetical protein
MLVRAGHRVSKTLFILMHAVGSTKTLAIPGNRLKKRVPVILPWREGTVRAGEGLETRHFSSQGSCQVRYRYRKTQLGPRKSRRRRDRSRWTRIGPYRAITFPYTLRIHPKAPRKHSRTALAAGLGTPNTQGTALEIHYNNNHGCRGTQDTRGTRTTAMFSKL